MFVSQHYFVQLVEVAPGGGETPASELYFVGTDFEGEFDTLSTLLPGVEYRVRVSATNDAWLTATALSPALYVDNSPPVCNWIIDGPGETQGDDIDTHTSEALLRACWSCSDPEPGSGIVSYDLQLRNAAGASLFGETVLGSATGASGVTCSSGLGFPLVSGAAVYDFQVTATDGIGFTHSVTSDGFIIDNTPAVQTIVAHGTVGFVVTEATGVVSTLSAFWDAWTEDFTTVEGYV